MENPSFLSDLLITHEPGMAAPGIGAASWQTIVPNEPRRCSALWFMRIMRVAIWAFLLLVAASVQAEPIPVPGHVPSAVALLKPLREYAGTNQLRLVVGLPLHNQAELDQLLVQLNNPAGTNYHHWLTPEEFSQRFGPTEEDYRKVIAFVQGKGLRVAGLAANRMLVDVEAPVAHVEKALHVTLRVYPHPTENRDFYAPDTEPTVDADVPIEHIAGLDNFVMPHPLGSSPFKPLVATNGVTPYATGSGPGGNFMGNDFRNAFVPGLTNTGAGQYIAIVDVGGPYYPLDVYMYETNAGLSTNTVVTNIAATPGTPLTLTSGTTNAGEQVLDIDMAMSMAPGATILNYEGEAHDVFNRIATDNKAKQMTLSYGFGIDSTIQHIFQEFVAQGQAMSQASGDGGADLNGGTGLTGAPYSTIVGGVSLNTVSPGGAWLSDPTWGGSGGGISGYGIPTWQQGINMTTNQGSVSYRNYPDVAMPADNIFTVYENGTIIGGTGGTSAASPLWAGFMALVNQQAASLGKPPVGFVNPAIYAIGTGSHAVYTNCFHDVTTGNTYNSHDPTRYAAGPGYDLCTGWGSPTGSNTINALVGTGIKDFTFYPSQATISLVAGSSANISIVMTPMNGLTGSAQFTITGMPAGIVPTINPVTTANATSMTMVTAGDTVPGSYSATLTGTIGSLSHTVAMNIIVSAPIPGAVSVNLAPYYNRVGWYSDGTAFGGNAGADGSSAAYSANLLGTSLSWSGLVFNLGPANKPDVVYCAGQPITLPVGSFNTLEILAAGVQGAQTAMTFTVTYTDNSTATFTQSFSDWANPQSFSGESTVITLPYRNLNDGTSQFLNVTVDAYSVTLDPTKTVARITLPSNSDVVLLAASLANEPVSVPLTSYYNRIGLYTNGSTFTASGGLDNDGSAYSATLLGGSLTWTNTVFNFGPANASNVIGAAGQTISLPAGKDAALRMLATGVQGGQTSQSFVVTYTDNSTTTFVQSLSDWYTPANYSGESKVVIMGYRDTSGGTADNRTFYLYGYSFTLSSAKTIKSIRLPSDANVVILAISLVPNWPPTFSLNPFTLPVANAGQPYSGTIATNASDLNGGVLTYAKVSGPGWLSVSGGGVLSGTPLSANVGANSFVVSVTDSGGLSNTATMNLTVQPSPITISIIKATNALWLNWSGGIAPYQLQMCADLAASNWLNIGSPISSNTFSILPTNPSTFYRLMGQ